jgi:hypothetical protein
LPASSVEASNLASVGVERKKSLIGPNRATVTAGFIQTLPVGSLPIFSVARLGGNMTKALLTLALMGLLATAAQVSSAQQEEAAQQPGQEQRPSGDDVFTGLDNDRDGMLTEEEFSRAFAPTATDDDKKKMFTTWDTDGDNKISKQEFLAKY